MNIKQMNKHFADIEQSISILEQHTMWLKQDLNKMRNAYLESVLPKEFKDDSTDEQSDDIPF